MRNPEWFVNTNQCRYLCDGHRKQAGIAPLNDEEWIPIYDWEETGDEYCDQCLYEAVTMREITTALFG